MPDDDDFDLYGDDLLLQEPSVDKTEKPASNTKALDEDDMFEGYEDADKLNSKDTEKTAPKDWNNTKSSHQKSELSSPPTSNLNETNQTNIEPNNPTELAISNLNWWISEDDIRNTCLSVGVDTEITELIFHENKINGKSKGTVSMKFSDFEACKKAKEKFDKTEYSGEKCIATYVSPELPPSKPTLTKNDGIAKRNVYPGAPNPRFQLPAMGMQPILPSMQRMNMNYMVPMPMQMQMQMGNVPMNPQIQMQQMMNRPPYGIPARPGFIMPPMGPNINQKQFQGQLPLHDRPNKSNTSRPPAQKRKMNDS